MADMILADGLWQLCPDPVPCQYSEPPDHFPLSMQLPGTTAQQQIGRYNEKREAGFLTEKYPFSGQIWLRRTLTLTPEQAAFPHCFLTLERTRMTRLWVNGNYIGGEQSLCTPHVYDLSGHTAETMELVLCIKNTDYPTAGGHMTSPDTQTNWIGVTGDCILSLHRDIYISDLQLYPDAANRRLTVRGILHGAASAEAELKLCLVPEGKTDVIRYQIPKTAALSADSEGAFSFTVPLPEEVPLWSEYTPAMPLFMLTLENGESTCAAFGLRDFTAAGDHFEINGHPVMLRGKHDGMAFPLTGAAPTDPESWLAVFRTMKKWGINHYRFHTCCPPEAAFAAADRCGIYMEPELPFWGTLDAPGGEKYNEAEQAYLLREGLRICKAFGNHPSFCMFSLGNELWGSPEQLGLFIDTLRAADPRPLYTQGSNNFQHMPLQIPQEDFWTGVRTGKGRLIRGSFADCDAPIGRMQTAAPSASWDYEQYLVPSAEMHADTTNSGAESEIEIQYGTGVKRVKAKAQDEVFFPAVPVVTHEIGQYNIYPDYTEIPKYTGVTEARNFVIFRERLKAAGMEAQAADFFRCSGEFSRECYKMELEAAMRSPHIAGFQILDLQDFPGQGTALVGMLNALLESKGLIEPAEWRGFCGDLVPLAIFDSYVWESGQTVPVRFAVRSSRQQLAAQPFRITLTCGGMQLFEKTGSIPENANGLLPLGNAEIALPQGITGKAVLTLDIPGEQVKNTWMLTILPPAEPLRQNVRIAHSFSEAEPHLQNGEAVLLLPEHITEKVEGFYCTDFWNYHMFKMISESMGRRVPVGTMGLCIDTAHPVARAMFSEAYSTPQWYMPVTHSDCAVLDAAPAGYRPIVQMIDNVERNHRLGLVFETAVSGGRLLVCTVRFSEAPEDPAMSRLYTALTDFMQSDAFAPEKSLGAALLRGLFG